MAAFIAGGLHYDHRQLVKAIESGLARLKVDLRGKQSAVLKPNIASPARPNSAVITHPVVVEAMVQVLRKAGVERIALAEGPGGGFRATHVFKESGYADLARRLDLPLFDLSEVDRVERNWGYGTILLPSLVQDADLYVNLAKMKTHGLTTVTLSLKNQKGLLSTDDKKKFHRNWGLHKPIVELAKVIAPHLAIVDGIVGMEGNGPSNGNKRRTGALIMGQNMLEVDLTCCKIMGIDADQVSHLGYAIAEEIGPSQPDLSGAVDWREPSYTLPNMEYGRVFNVYLWRNDYACSMCFDAFDTTVRRALRDPRSWFPFAAKFLHAGLFKRIDLFMGRHCEPSKGSGTVVCFGDCTRMTAGDTDSIFVEGCPPEPETIVRVLSERLPW